MSTPQTDSHRDIQKRMYENFVTMVDDFGAGLVDYDNVEDELFNMIEDDDVESHTYEQCRKYWEQAKDEEQFWQKEDYQKWEQIKDSNVY